MNTRILDYIIAIAEEKSVTRAAERCFLTNSALSKHLRNLEKELGAPIFRYGREGMQLTPEGMIFVNNAQAIRHLEQEMERKLSCLDQQENHIISVAVDDVYYNCIVREVMPDFRKKYPDLTVELVKCNASQARRLLLTEKAELAFFSSPTPRIPEVETMRVMLSQVFCVYPPDFPRPESPDALSRALGQGLLPVLHPVGNTIRLLEEQRLVQLGLNPEKILEGNYFNALHYVMNGMGIAFLPEGICELYSQKEIAMGERFMQFFTLIGYLPDRTFSPAIRELMERILHSISGGGLTTPFRGKGNSAGMDVSEKL